MDPTVMTGRPQEAPGAPPMAIVLGRMGIEIVRPLTRAGIPCGVVAPPGDPAYRSRHVTRVFDWDWTQPMERHDETLADRLARYGAARPTPPVVLCCSDEPMLFVSRHRERLASALRFVAPDRDLVEALVDKTRFAALARERGLPTPATLTLDPASGLEPPDVSPLGLPFIVKPKKLDRAWPAVDPSGAKAALVGSERRWGELWPRIRAAGVPAVAQRYVEGPESDVESYHVYVAGDGSVAAEFTGRKIRTLPVERGYSTALTTTRDPGLRELGRDIVRRLGLRGVAKLDFKRDGDGRRHLLEVNARLTLWNHVAAEAGVNVPALVHADLTGRPRPPVAADPAPATWWHPKDLVAARAHGIALRRWLPWAARADAMAFWTWDDPLPLAVPVVTRLRARALPGRRAGTAGSRR
jgi:predicted ATP-grasp superfamily ATP-dependent carboligase